MAAEVSSIPVNGNYAPHQGYGSLEQQNNNYAYGSNMSSIQQPAAPAPAPPATTASTAGQSAVSKDEVGWFFVEQYYTTLSRQPENVYLFYNKRSQFVTGQETDKVAVCVGQKAINEKIRELNFQDTKVRVTNVDSQASDSNIVIQVIGEISNKSQPHRKFVQTFILATQTNGYFVLNDIFRYLIDEEDEPEQEPAPVQEDEVQQAPAADSGYQEPAPTAEEAEPKTLTSSANPAEVESDAQKVDKQLEEQLSQDAEPAPSGAVNGIAPVAEEIKPAEDAPAAVPEPAAGNASRPETKDADLQPEKPAAPEPTPAATPPPKQAPPQPAPAPKPAAPAVPKTWASLAASANRVATPAAPSSSASSQASSQPRAAPPPKPAAAATPSAPSASTPPTAPAAQRDESPAASSQDEWTAVSNSHNRQQSRQVQQQQGPNVRGYIKNVQEPVREEELKAVLERFGEVTYLDISRTRSCAFVDFKTPEAYNAAVASNPHLVGGERLVMEERRQMPSRGQGSFNQRGQYQGGRGRGGPAQGGQGRGNFSGGGRGNFQGQRGGTGRGGTAPRGGATSQHT